MTLLITVIAAVITTAIWYKEKDRDYKLDFLSLMLWGASIMWFVDALFEFAELKAEYFNPAPLEMLNDAFLGMAVLALALVIWVVNLLVTDPQGRLKKKLSK